MNASGLLDNNLITGLAGGQTIKGGTGNSENLILTSTAAGTKGLIEFGSATGLVYDETNKTLGIGKAPAAGTLIDCTTTGSAIARWATTATNQTATISAIGTNCTIQLDANGSAVAGTILSGVNKASLATLSVPTGGAMAIVSVLDLIFGTGSTEAFRVDNATSLLKLGSASIVANGAVATAMSSLGPTGSHTTIQEWLTFKNSAGTQRWVPCF